MTSEILGTTPPAGDREREEFLRTWLAEDRPEALRQLWRAADETRERFVGNEVVVWGAIKISNHCDEECGFCGLRAENVSLPRFRLSAEDTLAAARAAAAAGCRGIVLQSGRDLRLAADKVADLIVAIGAETGLSVALSLGERSETELAAWRRAGAACYLLRFMTANPTLYRLLHARGDDDPRRRLPLLAALKKLGYRVGSGILVGFPGQSTAGLADDLEMIRTLDLDIVLAGPYVWPVELAEGRTPVRERDPNSAWATLKVLALARQLCPSADIPSPSALASAGGLAAHADALRSGANVLMLDVSPARARDEYGCYPGRVALDEAHWRGDAGGVRTRAERREAAPNAGAAAGAPREAAAAPAKLCIGVCMGSSCFSRGNNRVVAAIRNFIAGQGLENRAVVEGHLCQGQCTQGPNVVIDGQVFQHAQSAAILEQLRQRLQAGE